MTSLETMEGIWRTRPGGLAFAAYAESLETAGRLEESEQILSEGVARWPKSLSGHLLYGRIARERGDLDIARTAFQTAVQIDGNSRAALQGLADICTRQQYLKQAFESWSRLAILDPDNALAAESARRLASKLDTKGEDGFAPVREQEDRQSREALSEGAGALSAPPKSPTAMAPFTDFDLSLGEIPSPSSMTATAGFLAPTLGDLPGFQAPELSFSTLSPPSSTPLAKFEESAFATLEMPSFVSKSIPPPPLELPKAPAPEIQLLQPAPHPPAIQTFVMPDAPKPLAEAPQAYAAPIRASAGVTGDDIEDRLDEVFGESSVPMPMASTSVDLSDTIEVLEVAPADRSSGKVTGEDVEDRLKELFGETGEMPLAMLSPAPVAPVARATSPVVSGDDIEGRLDDLFGESVIDLTSQVEPHHDSELAETFAVARPGMELAPSEYAQAGDTSALERGGDTTIESRLPVGTRPGADSTTEMHVRSFQLDPERLVDMAARGSEMDPTGSTIDLSSIDYGAIEARNSPRLTAEDVDSRLDELFATSEFVGNTNDPTVAGRTGFVAKPPSPPGTVTGDDVEGRLDDLFGEDSDFPVSLPTVTFAEEYLRQGHKDKAISIYRQLLDRDPANDELRRRLDQIEGRS